MLKRIITAFLVLSLLLGALPLTAFAAKTPTVAELQAKYPHGKYWNSGNPDTYTSKACTHHPKGTNNACSFTGSCGCNSFQGKAIQCMGFAYQLAYCVYGDSHTFTKSYSKSAFDSVKPGDIVRYRNDGHSFFVYAVDNSYVYTADCSWNHDCKIRWGVKIAKSTVRSTFTYIIKGPSKWEPGTPLENDESTNIPDPVDCGCSAIYVGEYKCITENYPLNIRAGHGSNYKKVGEIPKGATVKVSAANGSWAHVSYGGVSGYASLEYLKLVKSEFSFSLEKNSITTPCNSPESLHINLSHQVPFTITYDKSVISVKQDCYELVITPLKVGSTTLTVKCSDDANIFASCTIKVNNMSHNFSEYIPDDNATCDSDATKTRTCSNCKKTESLTIEGTRLKDSAKSFHDVKKDKWYKNFIDYAYTNGIFSGGIDGTFGPENNITRAEFVQVLANISKADLSEKLPPENFTDVSQNDWFAPAVKWAFDNGIVAGINETEFAPKDRITREQMCVMLSNYIEKFEKQSGNTLAYTQKFKDDESISDWANAAVYKCKSLGLVNGSTSGLFNPKNNASRAEAATIFTNFHKAYCV